MKINLPTWATSKQQEGMNGFLSVANAYGLFSTTFEQDEEEDETSFYATVEWYSVYGEATRSHQFHIAYDYEATWDYLHNRVYHWQFIFGGEIGREISLETFFLELFQTVDRLKVSQTASDACVALYIEIYTSHLRFHPKSVRDAWKVGQEIYNERKV